MLSPEQALCEGLVLGGLIMLCYHGILQSMLSPTNWKSKLRPREIKYLACGHWYTGELGLSPGITDSKAQDDSLHF